MQPNKFLDPSDPHSRRKNYNHDVITCEKCGCQWMELILVQQYHKNHSVILGQEPAPTGDIGFWLYRCPKCLSLYEPMLTSGGPQDLARRGYDIFLDQIYKEEKEQKEQIPSEIV